MDVERWMRVNGTKERGLQRHTDKQTPNTN